MTNYFHYFTEIEERFQKRRGTLTILSPLDWALMETWREAGVPLEAVLRGIDEAFDKHDARATRGTRRSGRVNGLAWTAQSVMAATEALKEAALGAPVATPERESGFETEPVSAYLRTNAALLKVANVAEPAHSVLQQIAEKLDGLAEEAAAQSRSAGTEELERNLVVLEERMYAALTLVAPEKDQIAWREQAARGLTGSRGMSAVQLKQVTQQFLNRRILESHNLPRLSLFYMEHRG